MPSPYPVGGLDHKQVKSEHELSHESAWSEELESVPLNQRLKMLSAKATSESREEIMISAASPVDDVAKKEDALCDSLDFYSDQEGSTCEQNQHGAVHAMGSSSPLYRPLSETREIEYTDAQDDSITQLPNFQHFSSADIEISESFFEDLDHVVLKERQRMLLSRDRVGSVGPSMEHSLSDPSTSLVQMTVQKAGIGSDNCGVVSSFGKNDDFEKCKGNALEPFLLNEARQCSSGRSDFNEKSSSSRSLPAFRNIKVESVDDELQVPKYSSCLDNHIFVKSEVVNSDEVLEDIIDEMMLGDRMRLLASRKFPKTILDENFETSRKFVPSRSEFTPTLSELSKPLMMKPPRKRRKTITDSIETALEEDAPGLLQVLIEKGVLVDEIKLYGETEGDESLDESLIEESFSELEDVITKIFSQRQSLLKLAPIRCGKGERTSYCLACLISLVEQARYLRFRKWPVEWGWCRDLQSFIFVFKRHNRIVLERPEYGYATYFFELVDTLPVNWQIKRLVTAMKLTSCSRITLIENRALTVGEDLTEGEARVLMEYGWIPDSGLGTMLNYRDRVVHDRKNDESDTSEWRSKIGKLLTDGYNGGIIVPNDIPKKVTEYESYGPQIKLEEP